jgi:hypothetical protein
VLRDALRTYRDRFGRVAVTAFVVFGAVAAIDAIAAVLIVDHVDSARGDALASTVAAVLTMGGIVVYAGILDRVVGASLHGHRDPPLRDVVRELPLGRLFAADLVLASATLVGLALFVLPGIVVFTLWALVGPVITIERRALVDAFRRSRQLVWSRFWLTFLLVALPLQVEQAFLHAIDYTSLFEHPVLPAFVLNGLLGTLIASVIGLVEVVLAYELIAENPTDTHDDA